MQNSEQKPNNAQEPALQKAGVIGSEEYLVDVAWTYPYAGRSPIVIRGTCMEDAVNNFYKRGGGEIMHIYDTLPHCL